MTRVWPLAAGAALVAVAAPASSLAQLAPGFSGSSSTSYMDANEYWRTLRSFGACFARESESMAVALLATEPDSKAERELYKQITGREKNQPCLTDTSMYVPAPLLRGAVVEGLYKRGVALPAELRLAPPAAEVRTLGEAARCYAARHRSEVEALIAGTAPGSKKELAALSAMAPRFYACLPAKAQKLTFNPTQVRYRLAEALLRMPAAAVAQPAAQER